MAQYAFYYNFIIFIISFLEHWQWFSGTTAPVKASTENSQKIENWFSIQKTYNHETLIPDFYYSSSKKCWFCKICTNFTPCSGYWPFIEKAGGFGDHPSQRVDLHLGSERHQKAFENMQAFEALQNRHTSVHNILAEANLGCEIKKTTLNRFMLESLFWILHSIVLKTGHMPTTLRI